MNNDSQRKLNLIDRHARRFAGARSILSRRYARFERALQLVQEKHLPKIKVALDTAANMKSELERSISAAPELFKEPRTLTLHGIRLGMMDGKAAIALPKSKAKKDALLKELRQRFTPEEIKEKELILVTQVESASADALLPLFEADKELKIVGIEYTAAGDRVFIKPADHALDKIITKLLQEGLQKGTAAGGDDEAEEKEAA